TLTNADLYARWAGALVTQFGPGVLILALIGAMAAWRRRPQAAVLWAFTMVGTFLFLAVDTVAATANGPLPAYWGHSRLMLLFLPPALCFALEAFRMLARRRALAIILAGGTVLANLALRPLGWDGSRPPTWGDVVAETAGERYPYDQL